jgi:hypothetical protein
MRVRDLSGLSAVLLSHRSEVLDRPVVVLIDEVALR